MTVAKDVVQFLMNLFGDRQAAQDFLDDPEGVLETHGLGGVRSADVDAAMPVVLDYAPISVNASRFDQHYNAGGNDASTGHAGGGWTPPPGAGGHDDHGHAVEQLQHVVANYAYPSAGDDRSAVLDQSVSQNIWADGDVEQWFDSGSLAFDGPAPGVGGDMGFADARIDNLFDFDVATDAPVENAGPPTNPSIAISDSFSEDTAAYFDNEPNFTHEDPVLGDVDDAADAEEAEDHLEFDS
ncbi:IniB N-terminal domain-containing protein [Pseudarthrobacter sp. R1]|uniref:IniB N-terminal domain-containing protein n=1 Tax=Pseudarthrobacter sp. R1 TaxID=2944934 RepID=UPI00210AEB3C|nr:IniB N-terminal domain-containing protein [Pseudarthrobacter sp. R1]MCQ6273147.1 IniB N-terminal domain-containing protein [Pseudarthrobacter sp. R1]